MVLGGEWRKERRYNYDVQQDNIRTNYTMGFTMTDGLVNRGAVEFDSHDSLYTPNPRYNGHPQDCIANKSSYNF